MGVGLALVERDYSVMRDIERFRFCLGRHIKHLAGFGSQQKCDRRLQALIQAGYINRQFILYGVPSVLSLTYKGKLLIGANKRQDKIRVDRIIHDIAVLDTVIYFMLTHEISVDKIITEKEIHSQRGFGQRTHQPDYIFPKGDKKHCVEVELTLKSKQRFSEIVEENYLNYDTQYWIVPNHAIKIKSMLEDFNVKYQNIEIMELEEIQKIVRAVK